ncbi:MAG TPA: hypothetical protein VMM80_06085, partial [Bacteroidota bacterium]|nr:hypothetical protein [Bacteroidota bacterium]
MICRALPVLALLAAQAPALAAGDGGVRSPLDSLAITERGTPRQFCYTNGEGAFFDGWTAPAPPTGWEGFTVEGHRFIEDYEITVDGSPADRSLAVATIFPDYLRRVYPGGITEELHPVDSLAALVVTVTTLRPAEVTFRELLPRGAYTCRTATSALLAAQAGHTERTVAENSAAWLCLYSPGCIPDSAPGERGRLSTPGVIAS